MASGRPGADPFDRDAAHLPLDELDVGARVGREILVLGGAHRAALPARQGHVLHLDFLKDVGVARVRALHARPVRQLVGHGHLDLVEVVQHVQLGQVEGRVVVDRVRVPQQHEVEPPAASATASRDSKFLANRLQLVADVVQLLCREWTGADAGGVGLDHPDDRSDAHRVQRQALDGTADSSRGRRNERVGAVIQVQHEGIGTLDERRVSGMLVFLKESKLVDNVWFQDLTVFLQ